jgi:hypothetical protein
MSEDLIKDFARTADLSVMILRYVCLFVLPFCLHPARLVGTTLVECFQCQLFDPPWEHFGIFLVMFLFIYLFIYS